MQSAMNILVIGGGPAGLYFSILRKMADPSANITVIERNPKDVTWGFGVVFSDETLHHFDEADPISAKAITEGFIHWTDIEIHFKDNLLRSGGHGFAGIARKTLLKILHERATELGVKIQWHETCHPDDPRIKDADLVVIADGVKSPMRTVHADHFKPTLQQRHCHYIWLAAPIRLNTFTFSFKETSFGTFQIHAYPFRSEDPSRQETALSTVIVECNASTFQKAGFATLPTEESIAFVQHLFTEELQGAPLLSNNSSWTRFGHLTCEHWVHHNMVLIGDAAHTAHFSIGSGTKLAMEDAVALSESFDGTRDVEQALVHYEQERKNLVARIQRAAMQSMEWFEQVDRIKHLDPQTFAFSLLTRSRKITHENLRMRDANFIESVDSNYQSRSQKTTGAYVGSALAPAFVPLTLAETTFANRVMVSPMCQYMAKDGVPNDWHLMHYGARAVGGAGLLMCEMTNVEAEGRITLGCAGLWNSEQRDAWKRIVDFAHAQSDTKIGIQLGHAGPKASTELPWDHPQSGIMSLGTPLAWPTLGPSAKAFAPTLQTPRPMNEVDMERMISLYETSTRLALEAGFDVLEVHMGHGYLLSSFLSPLSNVREDAYGGSLHNRMRFPLRVFDAVRSIWPYAKPLSVRISATDWVEGGFSDDDAVGLSHALKAHGATLIDVSTGQTSIEAKPLYGRCYQSPFSERIKHEVGIPTITVGNIANIDYVNTMLAAEKADICALARPHLLDPHFTLRAAQALGMQDKVAWPKPYLSSKS